MDKKRAVFLPIDERILLLYKGYIHNGVIDRDLTEDDVRPEVKECTIKDLRLAEIFHNIRLCLIIPTFPIWLLMGITELIIRGRYFDAESPHMFVNKLFDYYLKRCFTFFLKKDQYTIEVSRRSAPKYQSRDDLNLCEEDVPAALEHCKEQQVDVFIYSYTEFTGAELQKLNYLREQKYIRAFVSIKKLSDLQKLVIDENISIHNSWLVIKDFVSEYAEAEKLGIAADNPNENKLIFWHHDIVGYDTSSNKSIAFYWESRLSKLRYIVEDYLLARDRLFFTHEYIFYVEDHFDETLNAYLLENYDKINEGLAPYKKQLLYLPALKNGDSPIKQGMFAYLRYKYPVMYSMTDEQLNKVFTEMLDAESPIFFYRIILEKLDFPLFRRPAFIRNAGDIKTRNTFTYSTIEYKEGDDLKQIMNEHLRRMLYPTGGISAYKVIEDPQEEFNADEFFNRQVKTDSEIIKQKVELLKAEGKFGLLAETLLFALDKLKDENPALIAKIKRLIENKETLTTELTLSQILIDKQKRIILPDFGNREIKMPTLSKAVYLLFLKHPEGIRFKELKQYKEELLNIYTTLTSKYDHNEIEQAVAALVDIQNPSLNQKCSRIREAFRVEFEEHVARYYYIDGPKGEPKKIAMAETFINNSGI